MSTTKLFLSVMLTALACAASPIYDMGLPCGSSSPVGCSYNFSAISASATTSSSSTYYSEPGRIFQNAWQNTATSHNAYNENAGSNPFGWWQEVGGYSLSELTSSGWSDDYRYEADWWKDAFSSGSYYSLSQTGWGTTLASDRITITLINFGWGNSSENWSSYYQNSGGASWPNGSSSWSNANWSNGGNGSSWGYFSQENYPVPGSGGGEAPEPATLAIVGAGLISIGLARRFRQPA